MNKLYKVKQTFHYYGWTFIWAKSKDEAERLLENGLGDFDHDEADVDCLDTEWGSLEECTPD